MISVYLAATVLTLALMLVCMPRFIDYLKNRDINQVTSEYALEEFKNKAKTPIMGGLLFVVIPVLVYLLLNIKALKDPKALFVLLSYVLFCSVGFLDDSLIIRSHNNDGLSPLTRLIMEFNYGLILCLLFRNIILAHVTLPFTGSAGSRMVIDLGFAVFAIFAILIYMAEVNAVNFTDGMDGLCAGVSFIALIPFGILAYLKGEFNILLLIVCILAGLAGYLHFNFHPARIFMGDSGSLALGGLFAALGIILDETVALFFIGGIFVVEMFCVCLQQFSVRVFHKRVFSYTPIHYAFVIKGHKETRIVLGFYLAQLILSIIGLIIGINAL